MDTPNKRASVIGLALASLLILPIPDGGVDRGDRLQLAASYRGWDAGSHTGSGGYVHGGTATQGGTSSDTSFHESAINLDLPFGRILPTPNGSVSQGDRQQLAGKYSGILAEPPGGTQSGSHTGSGGYVLNSSGTLVAGRVATGSGGFVFNSSGTSVAGGTFTGFGGITLNSGGSFIASTGTTGSGGAIFNGSGGTSAGAGGSQTGSGGVVFNSAATLAGGGSHQGSGGITFDSGGSFLAAGSHNGSGGVVFSGAYYSASSHETHTGSGGWVVSGEGSTAYYEWASGTCAYRVPVGELIFWCEVEPGPFNECPPYLANAMEGRGGVVFGGSGETS